MGKIEYTGAVVAEPKLDKFNFMTTSLNDAIGWARKYSIFQ